MIGFIGKLWRRHKVKAADRRVFMDQGRLPGHATGDSQHISNMNWDLNRKQ